MDIASPFFYEKPLKIRSEKMLKNLLLLADTGITDITWIGCILGIGVVFLGLVCIIGIIELMNLIVSKIEGAKKPASQETATSVAPSPAPAVNAPIENREELVAAICAAVAEENGTDISAIRVVSFKKL